MYRYRQWARKRARAMCGGQIDFIYTNPAPSLHSLRTPGQSNWSGAQWKHNGCLRGGHRESLVRTCNPDSMSRMHAETLIHLLAGGCRAFHPNPKWSTTWPTTHPGSSRIRSALCKTSPLECSNSTKDIGIMEEYAAPRYQAERLPEATGLEPMHAEPRLAGSGAAWQGAR